GRRKVSRGVVEEEGALNAQACDSAGMDLELERLLDEHREGMVVRTGSPNAPEQASLFPFGMLPPRRPTL
ncbi:unnamed protein product, partial [Urochloa humidicola]